MDASSIAAVATGLAQQSTAQSVNIDVLKKAQDAQKIEAAGLLAALPPPPAPVTSSMGHNINTQA